MWIRSLVEDLREPTQGEKLTRRPGEITNLLSGRYAFTRRILRIQYIPEVDPEFPDTVFYRLQVVREGWNGKPTHSNKLSSTTKPDHDMVWRLNEPGVLLRASNTESCARKAKARLGVAAIGVTCGAITARNIYNSHKK